MKKQFIIYVLVLMSFVMLTRAYGQITLSYSSPQNYTLGTAIPTLNPSVSGGTPGSGGQTTQAFVGNGSAGSSDGYGTSAYFSNPLNTAVDAQGNIYVADAGNHRIRKITPDGSVSTLAGSGMPGYADGTGVLASFQHPSALAIDATGNIFVSDQQNHRIRKITPGGIVTTFAGSGSIGSANGTGTAASFQYPIGLAFTSSGDLLVCDAWNNKIRKITTTGVVTTYAGTGVAGSSNATDVSATFNRPSGIAVDLASGKVYIADRNNHMIRRIWGGTVTTFAGLGVAGSAAGTGTAATFNSPTNVCVDAVGDLYVSDQANNMIRKINSGGVVTNFAGTTTSSIVNGTGSVVRFTSTYGLSIDKQGNVYIAQNASNIIRKMVTAAYNIYPNLPNGLAFNNTNGQITGTPTVAQSPRTYYVQAFNPSYASNVVNLTISVSSIPAGIQGSVDQNYVSTYTPKVNSYTSELSVISASTDKNLVSTKIEYFDGLGRPVQKVDVMGNNDGTKDLVTSVDYDDFGRLKSNYQPYMEGTGDGSYRAGGIASAVSYYQGTHAGVVQTAYPYSRPVYEPSPHNRIIEQGASGASWQPYSASISGSGHTQKTGYQINTAADTVKLWKISGTTISTSGNYLAGELSRTTTKDENWTSGNSGTKDFYKDKEDQLICSREWISNTVARSTYYIYDEFNRLRYVIPPIVTATSITESASGVFNDYLFAYHYDGRGRLIEKKVPVKGWEEIVYDKLDRVVLTRDAVKAAAGKWLFRKYDTIGRTIVTGIINSSSTRSAWQNSFNATTRYCEQRDNANSSGAGTGYTNVALPLHSAVQYYHKITYYDDYNFYGNSFGNPTVGQSTAVKDLITGSKTNILGSNTMLLATNYYDSKGQLIQTKNTNHLSGSDILSMSYNFSGQITSSTRTHTVGATTTMIYNTYEHDHAGRRTKTYSKTGNSGSPQVLLSELFYNEIGQVKDKSLHNATNTTSYAYNEPGWIKTAISNEFSYRLKYNDGTTPQFNKNIANQDWGSSGSFPNSFSYTYDNLNRLTNAASTGIVMSEAVTYDPIGNIKSMNRNGTGVSTYNYSANKLSNISGGGIPTGTYAYDLNGNATTDGRTGITFTYNILDLPATATKSGVNMTYTYDADGNKLSEVNTSTSTTRHYVSGIEYNGSTIDFIKNEEGVASNNAGTYTYQYFLTDHLGNVRYVFYKHPTTGSIVVIQQGNYHAFGKYVPTVGGLNRYLFNGKEILNELNSTGEGGEYDFGARVYDPVTGRWNVLDPADQFYSMTGYAGMGNNPAVYVDPDGRFIHIIVGAVVGGVINLGVKAFTGKIKSWKDGFAAFGIGAVAGGLGAATGGLGLAASGFASTSFIGGAAFGIASAAVSSPVLGIGNNLYFGDPYSLKSFGRDVLLGGLTGGVMGGITAKIQGKDFWTGLDIPKPTVPQLPDIPTKGLTDLELYSQGYSDELLAKAKELYPKLANKIQYHHIEPIQIGGAVKGATIPLDAAYHQMITNEFRKLSPFKGLNIIFTEIEKKNMMLEVYKKIPLPPGGHLK